MNEYAYTGWDRENRAYRGTILARDRREAFSKLSEMRFQRFRLRRSCPGILDAWIGALGRGMGRVCRVVILLFLLAGAAGAAVAVLSRVSVPPALSIRCAGGDPEHGIRGLKVGSHRYRDVDSGRVYRITAGRCGSCGGSGAVSCPACFGTGVVILESRRERWYDVAVSGARGLVRRLSGFPAGSGSPSG